MPKLELNSQQRRALRAAAHPLHPIVLIGDRGLTATVIGEIDRSLTAHELIKVRIAGAERDAREAMLAEICETLSCAAVHHLGKTLIIYRPDLLAQQAMIDAENATRAIRRKSDPYVPKKLAAQGPDAKPPARKAPARSAQEAMGHYAGNQASEPKSRPANRSTRTGAAPAHGIPRRSGGGSALTLRAGARRGRTTRS